MKLPSLSGAALGLTALASSCFSEPPPVSAPEEIAMNEHSGVQSFVDCETQRIREKIEARRNGEDVPSTTEADIMACAKPAFDLTSD